MDFSEQHFMIPEQIWKLFKSPNNDQIKKLKAQTNFENNKFLYLKKCRNSQFNFTKIYIKNESKLQSDFQFCNQKVSNTSKIQNVANISEYSTSSKLFAD